MSYGTSTSDASPGASRLPIDSIVIGQRHRRDMGDIPALAANIREIGLLHPLPVKPNGELIAGARRLAACKLLDWTEIPVHVVDLDAVVKGEYAENEYRKAFAPSEAVTIKRALEPLEKAEAKKRQRKSKGRGKRGGQVAPPLRGRAADRAAKATGMARRTLEKAEAVVDAAEAEPDKYGKLVEDMDRTGKVDGAYRKLLEARGEKPISKSLSTDQQVAHPVRVQRMMDAGEIEHLTAENRRLSEELKAAHQSNQKPKAANDTVSRIAEIACEIISLDASCSCEFDNKVPSNLLPLIGQASAVWAELTKRLAAQVEINNAPPSAASITATAE
jgi:ParB family chromosome partitioning protein